MAISRPNAAGTPSWAQGTNDVLTPTYPTVAAGDLLILVFYTRIGLTVTPQASAEAEGFTLYQSSNNATYGSLWVFAKRATGTESGTINIDSTSGTNGTKGAVIIAYRGVCGNGGADWPDLASPPAIEQEAAPSSPYTYTNSGITTVNDNAWVLFVLGVTDGNTSGNASGWAGNSLTWVEDHDSGSTSGTDAGLAIASAPKASHGATGNLTVTGALNFRNAGSSLSFSLSPNATAKTGTGTALTGSASLGTPVATRESSGGTNAITGSGALSTADGFKPENRTGTATDLAGSGSLGTATGSNTTGSFSFLQAQTNLNTGDPADSVQVTIATTAGSLLVALVRNGTIATATHSISDSATQTWTQDANGYLTPDVLGWRGSIWYKINSAAITSVTASFTGSPGPTATLIILEFAAPANVSLLGQGDAIADGDGVTSLTSGSVSVSEDKALLVFGVGFGGDPGALTQGANFTIPTNGSSVRSVAEYRITTAPFSGTGSVSWVTAQSATGDILAFGVSSQGETRNGTGTTLSGTGSLDTVPGTKNANATGTTLSGTAAFGSQVGTKHASSTGATIEGTGSLATAPGTKNASTTGVTISGTGALDTAPGKKNANGTTVALAGSASYSAPESFSTRTGTCLNLSGTATLAALLGAKNANVTGLTLAGTGSLSAATGYATGGEARNGTCLNLSGTASLSTVLGTKNANGTTNALAGTGSYATAPGTRWASSAVTLTGTGAYSTADGFPASPEEHSGTGTALAGTGSFADAPGRKNVNGTTISMYVEHNDWTIAGTRSVLSTGTALSGTATLGAPVATRATSGSGLGISGSPSLPVAPGFKNVSGSYSLSASGSFSLATGNKSETKYGTCEALSASGQLDYLMGAKGVAQPVQALTATGTFSQQVGAKWASGTPQGLAGSASLSQASGTRACSGTGLSLSGTPAFAAAYGFSAITGMSGGGEPVVAAGAFDAALGYRAAEGTGLPLVGDGSAFWTAGFYTPLGVHVVQTVIMIAPDDETTAIQFDGRVLPVVDGQTPEIPLHMLLSLRAAGWIEKPSGGPTGGRPIPPSAAAGLVYFDTDLGKPIWWTGTGWVDAAGVNPDV